MEHFQEEIIVLFHAAFIGRADVAQNAIKAIKTSGKLSEEQIVAAISTKRSEDHATPLHIATSCGHTDVLRALLTAGADLSVSPSVGEYANKRPYDLADDATKSVYHVHMFEQIAMGNQKAIRLLIEGGVSPNIIDDSTVRDSGLHWASSFGNVEVAVELLSHGSEVNILNAFRQTPLHVACKNNHCAVAQLLLDEGADAAAVDCDGKLAQQYVRESNTALLQLLADPPVPTRILHHAFLNSLKSQTSEAPDDPPVTDTANEDAAAKASLPAVPQHADTSVSVHHDWNTDSGILMSNDDKGDTSSGAADDSTEPLLIFWPPVHVQSRRSSSDGLTLSSRSNLLVCLSNSEVDIFQLLTWSGLLDILDSFGFQVQIKRAARGAQIRLGIDRNICPTVNSYELSVGREQVYIVAADSAGLLYGVYTLIQLMKLHSDIQASADGSYRITIPAISIRDGPDVAQRGVLWSYRYQVRTSSPRMRDQIELLSRMRINMLHLLIDPAVGGEHAKSDLDSADPKIEEYKTNVTSTKVFALDEICKRHSVDLIPTVHISSIKQRLPLDVLKNFSHSLMSIVFLVDEKSIADELAPAGNGGDAAVECYRLCADIINEALLTGCSSVYICTNEWVRTVANPFGLASSSGLSVSEQPFSTMYPSSLFSKPLFATQDYIQSISMYSLRVQQQCSTVSVFPAFMDRDFMYPALLLKVYTFLYAGFVWNRASIVDMLGDPSERSFSCGILREVLYLLLFPARSDVNTLEFSAMMDLITGQMCSLEMAALRANEDCSASASGRDDASSGQLSQLAQSEKLLWALLTAHDTQEVCSLPSKSEVALCLKVYRRVLASAGWKVSAFENKTLTSSGLFNLVGLTGGSSRKALNFSVDLDDSSYDVESSLDTTPSLVLEVEELYSIVNMQASLCKCIVLAFKSYEKTSIPPAPAAVGECEEAVLLYQQLFDGLSVGTKSDVANSVLESLHSFAYLWKRRFDRDLLRSFRDSNSLLRVVDLPVPTPSQFHRLSRAAALSHTIRVSNKRFVTQDVPILPAVALFKVVSKQLPLPKSVEEFIQRLFTR